MNKNTGRLYTRSQFSTHHVAGDGIVEDDYSEEFGLVTYDPCLWELVKLPNDHIKPEDRNGPVIIISNGRE